MRPAWVEECELFCARAVNRYGLAHASVLVASGPAEDRIYRVMGSAGAGADLLRDLQLSEKSALVEYFSWRTMIVHADAGAALLSAEILAEMAVWRARVAMPLATSVELCAGIFLLGDNLLGKPCSESALLDIFSACSHLARSIRPTAPIIGATDTGDFVKQRAAFVRQMAAGLSHELGNAVAPLSAHYQLLNESLDDEAFRVSLNRTMGDAVRRFSRFSNQMLFLGREDISGDDLVTVGELVYDAFHAASGLHPALSARLDADKANLDNEVRGHGKALAPVFLELTRNSLQASQKQPVVSVRAERSGEKVLVHISDNGPGFDDDALAHATEPFFSTKNVGPGLGLATAKHILDAHKGFLEIHNRVDELPTTVTVHLPVATPSGKSQRPPQHPFITRKIPEDLRSIGKKVLK